MTKNTFDFNNLSEFYTSVVTPRIGDLDVGNVYPEEFKKLVDEVDDIFANIEPVELRKEITALRFELFALAWQMDFGVLEAILLEKYTLRWLDENNLGEIWLMKKDYNIAIWQSVLAGKDDKTSSDEHQKKIIELQLSELKQAEQAAKSRGINIEDEFGEQGNVKNRIFARRPLEEGSIIDYLIGTLLTRLSISNLPNKQALKRMEEMVAGLYLGCHESIDEIKGSNQSRYKATS